MADRTMTGTGRRGSATGRVLARAGAVAALLLVLAGGMTAVALATQRHDEGRAGFAMPGGRLVIQSGDGDVRLRPGPPGRIEISHRATWAIRRPAPAATLDGPSLRLRDGCPTWSTVNCTVRFDVRVPPGTTLRVVGDDGDVDVAGLTGDLDLTARDGRIKVDGATGALRLATRDGGIGITGAVSPTVTATSTDGGIQLDFAGAPRSVTTHARDGGTTITVPAGGRYRVDASTRDGRLAVGLPSNPGAPNAISAYAVDGSVTVRTR